MGMHESSFADTVDEEIRRRLCTEAVSYVGEKDGQVFSRLLEQWYGHSSSTTKGIGLNVQLTLTGPVIGVGAPAQAYLPLAFRHLQTECIVPKSHQVSVAVGAVVGIVDITITGKIVLSDAGRYCLYTPAGRYTFPTLREALEQGQQILDQLARERMEQSHVNEPLLDFVAEEKRIKTGHGEEIYLETELRLRATGRPNVWSHV
jgi:N-methylhydantoinase A/oxoprolinase/acetone carboxylase beta subunit